MLLIDSGLFCCLKQLILLRLINNWLKHLTIHSGHLLGFLTRKRLLVLVIVVGLERINILQGLVINYQTIHIIVHRLLTLHTGLNFRHLPIDILLITICIALLTARIYRHNYFLTVASLQCLKQILFAFGQWNWKVIGLRLLTCLFFLSSLADLLVHSFSGGGLRVIIRFKFSIYFSYVLAGDHSLALAFVADGRR